MKKVGMKRALVTLLFLIVSISVFARQGQDSPSMKDRAVSASITFAKNVWAKVQKEGRPLADKMLKAAPEYYKGTQKTLQDFVKQVNQANLPKTWSEKQRMALELWKLRGAIDVMALSDPSVLKALINIQPEAVQKMQQDLSQTETKLKKANLPGI